MASMKQLEALVAFAEAGTFEAAGARLGISQSAVSRHVLELEAQFADALLDRQHRSARLTLRGREVLRLAHQTLRQRDALVERIADPSQTIHQLRLGVTELTAMTWLPRFVHELRAAGTRTTLSLEVANSVQLRACVASGKLDLAFIAENVGCAGLARQSLGLTRTGWYCQPQLLPRKQQPLSPQFLARHTLLLQDDQSGTGRLIAQWLTEHGVVPGQVIECDSLAAASGIAVSGLGLANLPTAVSRGLVRAGLLREIMLEAALPVATYIAVHRNEAGTPFLQSVVALARQHCDFERPFQETAPAAPLTC
ncbi:LysR family transcriptional regulator [Orrella sp. JC864]|uniref:LysR family transcriptional regulator n=1 Tax=Orrella sp. JC864 TaxID=3120298 RepID=UPI0030093BF3